MTLCTNWLVRAVHLILRQNLLPDIVAGSFTRKASRVLNLITTGFNHENYTKKKYSCSVKHDIDNVHNKNKCKKRNLDFNSRSFHAEEVAIEKLRSNKRNNIINVSLIVVRITSASNNNKYKLTNSRPCINCVHNIKNAIKYGYRISKIYYSNEFGKIVCYRLKNIIKEKQHLSKYYRNNILPDSLVKEFSNCCI